MIVIKTMEYLERLQEFLLNKINRFALWITDLRWGFALFIAFSILFGFLFGSLMSYVIWLSLFVIPWGTVLPTILEFLFGGIITIMALMFLSVVIRSFRTRARGPEEEIPEEPKLSSNKFMTLEETSYRLRLPPVDIRRLIYRRKLHWSWTRPGKIPWDSVTHYLMENPEEVKRVRDLWSREFNQWKKS